MQEQESSLKVRDIAVDLLIPNEDNINEMDEETLARLVEEINEVGFLVPLQVIPIQSEDPVQKYMILGGEHRWKAGKIAGFTMLPCVVLTDAKWSDKDLVDLVSFRLNGIRGKHNPVKFMKMYEKMSLKFGADRLKEVFAVTDKSLWNKLTKDVQRSMQKSGMPEDLIDKIGEEGRSASDMAQFQKKITKVFKDYHDQESLGVIIFTNKNNPAIIIQATESLYSLMELVHNYSSDKKININELLEPAVASMVKSFRSDN